MAKIVAIVALIGLCVGCGRSSAPVTALKQYPLDSMEGVISKTNVVFDDTVTHDGSGSLRITAAKPMTVRLFETGDLGISGVRLTYQAMMRTEALKGRPIWKCCVSSPGKVSSSPVICRLHLPQPQIGPLKRRRFS